MRQRRRDHRLGYSPVVQAAFGGEELERRLGLVPGRFGGRGLIPELLGLVPQPVRCRAMTLTRVSLTAKPIEFLLSRVGALQGTAGRAPGRPQRTTPFTERVENVERFVEVRQTDRATAGALEFDSLTQA